MEFLQRYRRMAVSHWQCLVDDPFDILNIQALIRRGKRHGMSGKFRAAGTADAVDIIFRIIGQIIIDDQFDAFDINTACGNVRGHQDTVFTAFKTFQSFFALAKERSEWISAALCFMPRNCLVRRATENLVRQKISTDPLY